MNIITLDIGTQSTKASVYDDSGAMLFEASKEYSAEFIPPGKVEQDPDDWRNAAIYTLSKVAAFAHAHDIALSGISITSQRASVIPVTADGRPLHNAIMWQDKRTLAECAEIEEKVSAEEVYQITGLRLGPYAVAPRMRWIKNHQPEIYHQAAKLIGVQDYVNYCLTGTFKTDWSQAARTMLMNIRTFEWDARLLAATGVTVNKLCELVPPGTITGNLTLEMQKLTGLPALCVIVAGGDQQVGALAGNVVKPGQAQAVTGTGTFIIAYTDQPSFDPDRRVIVSASADAGKWIIEASIFNSGQILRWAKQEFAREIAGYDEAYAILMSEAKNSPIGANGLIIPPHFEGSAAPYWEPKAKGLVFNLSIGTKRADILRAIVEGIACEIADNVELLSVVGTPITQLTAAGGMANSEFFTQMQADAANVPVLRFSDKEASSKGAAMSGFVALGQFTDLQAAARSMLDSVPQHNYPIVKNHETYSTIRLRKHKLVKALQENRVYDEFMTAL